MAIIVYCKDCGKKIRVPDGPPGRHGRCPQCQAQVAIPAESETAPPPAAHLKKTAVERAEKAKAAGTSLDEDAPTPPEAQKAVAVEEPPAPKPSPKLEPKPAKEKPSAAPKTAAEPEAQPDAADVEVPAPKPNKAPAAKADAPKLRAPTGKPARIALDLKQVEKAALEEKSEKASNHARAKGSAVVEQHGGISWDTSPDPAPSRAPYILGAIVAVLIGLGYGAWYFFLRTEAKRMSPEERKRLQFEVPAAKDEIKQLQEGLPPPPAVKPPPAESETHKSTEAPPPAEKSGAPAPAGTSGENQ